MEINITEIKISHSGESLGLLIDDKWVLYTRSDVFFPVQESQVKTCNNPAVIKSAFKCDDIELQPIECEKWRGCFDCPHYKAVL